MRARRELSTKYHLYLPLSPPSTPNFRQQLFYLLIFFILSWPKTRRGRDNIKNVLSSSFFEKSTNHHHFVGLPDKDTYSFKRFLYIVVYMAESIKQHWYPMRKTVKQYDFRGTPHTLSKLCSSKNLRFDKIM